MRPTALLFLALALSSASIRPAELAQSVFWRLSSGLRVLAQEVRGSGLVAVAVVVGAGPRVEEPGQAGISILTREVMLRGTLRRTGPELAEALDRIGASLQARTGPDHTEWTLLVPKEHVDQALELLAEVLTQPRFAPEEVEVQRRVNLVRLHQQRDQPSVRAVELVYSLLYRWHPYRHPLLGTPETLAKIGREDLVRYHATFYTAPNTVVSVAGDLPVPVAVAKVQRAFARLGASPLPARLRTLNVGEGALVERPRQRREVREFQQTAASWIAVGYLGVPVGHPDWAALRVTATLLGGGMASRLFEALREREGLAYAVDAAMPTQRGPAALVLRAGVEPGNVERALEIILREVEDLRKRAPSEQEVARARTRAAGLHLLDHEDLRRRAFYPAWYELLGVGYRFDGTIPDLLFRVRSADIQRVARHYLMHPVVIVVGPHGDRPANANSLPVCLTSPII